MPDESALKAPPSWVDGALVGRGRELADVVDALERGRSGGTAVVVDGEAGIGKSALLHAALEHAASAGFDVLHAAADEIDRHRPFHVVGGLLGGLPAVDRVHRDFDAPGFLAVRLAELLSARVESAQRDRPVIVAVDDMHWADPLSVAVLHQLSQEVADQRVTLLLTCRPTPRDAGLARLLHDLLRRGICVSLAPLDDSATSSLVSRLLGAEPTPALLAYARDAGGNPLFLLEMVRGLAEVGAIVATSDGRVDVTGSAGPPSLSLTVLQRLSLLSAESLDVLALAAVLGSSFTAGDLAVASGRRPAELMGPLREAMRAGIVRDDGSALSFRHELIRTTLYQDLPESFRATLHADIARTMLATGEDPAGASVHLARAGAGHDLPSARALHAPARELLVAAPAAAAELLERARGLCAGVESAREGIDADLALALLWAGDPRGEAQALDVLRNPAAAGDREQLHLRLVETMLQRGDLAGVIAELDALLAAPYLDKAGATARALRAFALALRGDGPAAAQAAEDAIAEALAVGDHHAQCQALLAAAHARALSGDLAGALERTTSAVTLADEVGTRVLHQPLPLASRAHFLVTLGRLDEARRDLERGRRVCESVGCRIHMAIYDLVGCETSFCAGLWEQAYLEAESCRELTSAPGTAWAAGTEAELAAISVYRGDIARARSHLDIAEASADVSPHTFGWTVFAKTVYAEAVDGPAAAADVIRHRWPQALAAGAPAITGSAILRILLRAGDRETALALGSVVELLAQGLDPQEGPVAAARWCRALLDGDADAVASAAQDLGNSTFQLQHAQACEDAAVLFAEHGSADRSRTLARQALDAYGRLGAEREARRAEQRLRDAGVRLGVRGARRRAVSGWAALTPTELKVAELAAVGRTNTEIAETLFVSRHTVHTHVAHVLAKLGVASRVELAAAHALRAADQV